jgi:hypothetical protein
MQIADIFLLNAGLVFIVGVVVWVFMKEKDKILKANK